MVLPVLVLESALRDENPLQFGLATGIAALIGFAALILLPQRRYRAWGYREEEDELHIGHGLLVRVSTVVPFGRVQHIDIAHGPIERRLGLATLILHTAGTRSASVSLPGLLEPEAERCATASAPRSARTWCDRRFARAEAAPSRRLWSFAG